MNQDQEITEVQEEKRVRRCRVHGDYYEDLEKTPGCPFCYAEAKSREINVVDGLTGAAASAKLCTDNWKGRLQAAEAGSHHTLGDCLDEAKATICGERQDQYGRPEDSFALIADYLSTYLRHEYNSDHHHLQAKDVAHMMILFKVARCQGQKLKRDSYIDICGYAAITADRLMREKV